MAEKDRVVVFEDNDVNYGVLLEALKGGLDADFDVKRYNGSQTIKDNRWSEAEAWVRGELLSPTPAVLAVIDWDLTGFAHPAQQQFIRGVAEDLAIPMVLYQSDTQADRRLERLRRWQERRIAVESNTDQQILGALCADVAIGFRTIRKQVAAQGEKPRLLDALKLVLGHTGDEPLHLEQFAVGNQEVLGVVQEKSAADYQRFISTWIGYLIYNRILQYPGPILGVTATAAYLGVSPEELKATEVQEQLKPARYRGPFANSHPSWWRHGLDAWIVGAMTKEDTDVPLGRRVLETRLNRKVAKAKCHEGEELDEQAYQCILTGDVVCIRHSDAPEAWIPQGSDRCRIHNDEFELLRGWLGI